MSFELFGVPFVFSFWNVTFALAITVVIYWMTIFFKSYRMLSPYKKDRNANQAFLFLRLFYRDYMDHFQTYKVKEYEPLRTRLLSLYNTLDIQYMQHVEYNQVFQETLRESCEEIRELHIQLKKQKSDKHFSERELEKILYQADQLFYTMIVEINANIEQEKNQAA